MDPKVFKKLLRKRHFSINKICYKFYPTHRIFKIIGKHFYLFPVDGGRKADTVYDLRECSLKKRDLEDNDKGTMRDYYIFLEHPVLTDLMLGSMDSKRLYKYLKDIRKDT
jgi:hypothetical protein